MTSCSKAKQKTILANSARFAHRCRELLAIEYGNNPKILELVPLRLQEEIVIASARRKSRAKLLIMRLAASSPKASHRSVRSRVIEFLNGLVRYICG